MKKLSKEHLADLLDSIHDDQPVTGFTHSFYRYPARFSPRFVRAVINAFTTPGDVVYDPYMGGGTTLVEAAALGRQAIGTDINSLAVFVAKVKTTPVSNLDVTLMRSWISNSNDWSSLRKDAIRASEWMELGYQKNISGRTTWPIRKLLELALANLSSLPKQHQRDFIRCVLLRTAQWALDCRQEIPSATAFRERSREFFEEMSSGAIELKHVVRKTRRRDEGMVSKPLCLMRSVVGVENSAAVKKLSPPRIILTSPPYPGVHVLYHRWQVNGRKETPAPYWIADSLDGSGASYYTFGSRKQASLQDYFDHALKAYSSLARIANERTLMIQLIAFSDPSWQLPRLLKVLELAGFREVIIPLLTSSRDERVCRQVPNRKFYAGQKGNIAASKEVLLVHRLQ